MKAIVIGATGQIGRTLVNFLLNSSRESRVTAIVRNLPADPQQFFNATDATIPRLSLRVVPDFTTFDFSSIFDSSEKFTHAFSTLGTTSKKSSSLSEYYLIDHDYAIKFATAARSSGVLFFSIVTSMGASINSPFNYLKLKGEIERDISALNFPVLCILRPGFLLSSNIAENRPWYEGIFLRFICPIVEFMFPLKYTIQIEDVAMSMVVAATNTSSSSESTSNVLENRNIIELASGKTSI